MKGFLWNLKLGCKVVAEQLPKYRLKCREMTGLANVILDRIENERLPLIQVLVEKNKRRFEDPDQ